LLVKLRHKKTSPSVAEEATPDSKVTQGDWSGLFG
jgi:hypothetical protein